MVTLDELRPRGWGVHGNSSLLGNGSSLLGNEWPTVRLCEMRQSYRLKLKPFVEPHNSASSKGAHALNTP
jgi:hypothetical protein